MTEPRPEPTAVAVSGHAATVEFVKVTKHFDDAARRAGARGAVNDLTLTVPAGKICVLVGPSGCGKTTSLKMVNRLIEPTSGQILLDGVDVESTRPDRAAPRHRLRDPADRPVPAPDGARERRDRAAPARLARGAAASALRGAAGARRPRPGHLSARGSRRSSRAASASASASPGRSRQTRRSC